jgi:hypothetical protein
MKLLEFFKTHNLKPTPWAIENKIPPSVISRYLNGRGISPENALKVEIASDKKVTIKELLYREKAV